MKYASVPCYTHTHTRVAESHGECKGEVLPAQQYVRTDDHERANALRAAFAIAVDVWKEASELGGTIKCHTCTGR